MNDWIKKEDITICCPQETHFSFKETNNFKKRDGKRYFTQVETKKDISHKWKPKKIKNRVAIHSSNKIDVKEKMIASDKVNKK